jgi:hypothetical protein
MFKLVLPTMLVAILMIGCAQQPDAPNAIADATKVIDQFPAALESGNMDVFSQIISHDSSVVMFGTDAAEYWVGYPAVEAAMKEQLASFKDIKLTISNQKVNISPQLDAVWFSEMADWSMTVNDQPVDLTGLRITGVLTSDPGGWKIVQMHVSVPVTGQAAEY